MFAVAKFVNVNGKVQTRFLIENKTFVAEPFCNEPADRRLGLENTKVKTFKSLRNAEKAALQFDAIVVNL
jgi:hypothetical protein